jgi:hypothetical protein
MSQSQHPAAGTRTLSEDDFDPAFAFSQNDEDVLRLDAMNIIARRAAG